MSDLTNQHITILRALVQQARTTNSDVGMDVNVLAALLNERDALRREAQALYNDLYDMSMDATHIDVCDRLRATYPHLEAQREATQ